MIAELFRLTKLICCALVFCAFLICTSSAIAYENDAARPRERTQLKGNVETVVVTLNDLRDVSLDLRHLQHGATNLFDEVTTQQVTLQTVPSFVGRGTIINIPVGVQPTGEILDARPRKVMAAMDEIRSVSTLLKMDADAFLNGQRHIVLPGESQKELNKQLKYWVLYVDNIYAQLGVLERLTARAPYKQAEIAQAAWAIDEDVKDLESIRTGMYRCLEREAKRQSHLSSASY